MLTAEHCCICCCVAENSCCSFYRLQLHECSTLAAVACRAVRGVILLCIAIACCRSDAACCMHRQQQSTLSAELLRCCTVSFGHLLYNKHMSSQSEVCMAACTGGVLCSKLCGRRTMRFLLMRARWMLIPCLLWLFTTLLSISNS